MGGVAIVDAAEELGEGFVVGLGIGGFEPRGDAERIELGVRVFVSFLSL